MDKGRFILINIEKGYEDVEGVGLKFCVCVCYRGL